MRVFMLVAIFLAAIGCYRTYGSTFAAAFKDVPAPPPPPPGALAQYCTYYGTTDPDPVNAFLAKQALKGWALTAFDRGYLCFRYEGSTAGRSGPVRY